ncbi:MAG: excinuclease ABC subunit UvrA [Amoebophilaceae bacterium]|nr:excinuclease ABC subunit UvrA [Amoebophilaceae bacterium]
MDHLNPKDFIIIKGAKIHNLKNLDVAIPRNQFVVVTGLSGSGKSSLIFDTLFVEAYRMYVESLSAYARQFLGRMQRPPVDFIKGLAPAIAIQQSITNRNPHSTVGTATELCDYFNLLYARIGITYSPISGQKVTKDIVSDVVDYIQQYDNGTKVLILYPIIEENTLLDRLRIEQGKGFTRVMQGGHCFFIDDLLEGRAFLADQPIYGLVDRIMVQKEDQTNQYRIADSVQVAFFEGKGHLVVEVVGRGVKTFSDRFELDGMLFEPPTVHFFSFNTPHGACKACQGLGHIVCIDESKVVPDPTLSLLDGAIAPWATPTMRKWLFPLLSHDGVDLPMDVPYLNLTADQKDILWKGSGDFLGIHPFFDFCATQTHKIQYRVLLARYRTKTKCPSCRGTRVRSDAHYVKIGNHSLIDLLLMPVHALVVFFDNLSLTERERSIAERILAEIKNRLHYLEQVGLDYLLISRPVASLSGGEYQRIKMAIALGSPLVGTIYMLDEPTMGLHPRDTDKLINLLLDLKKQGNTVIVVEHEELVMRIADTIIEIGPEAGLKGGSLIFQGSFQPLLSAQTYTAQYLNGMRTIPIPLYRRSWKNSLSIIDATLNNLKQVTVEIPLNVLTVVTGVSGSGKSSLIKEVLYPFLRNYFAKPVSILAHPPTPFMDGVIEGDLHCIHGVELVSQQTLGKSSRSNPATYLGIYDYIRSIFQQTALAQMRKYQMGHFSFNAEKGQCTSCKGEGVEKIEMQFMADIFFPCDSCKGSRFKAEILDITYCGKDIAAVLAMTIDESLVFFEDYEAIYRKLKVLQEIGLGYLQLGQSSSSLSGGEAQRLKLACYLSKELVSHHTLYIFDEPTTGLHMHDVHKLLIAMQDLVKQGHTVLVIEHNLDVIKSADWIIDLGPDGGSQGGEVVFTGTPEELIRLDRNYTASYLRKKMLHQPRTML